jgi:uncharacterized protein YdeI (YjbR/CyaY-like superfamily)
MPKFVCDALVETDLVDAYDERPADQQNDYIGWIMRAKRADTRDRRLIQMLDELGTGDRYMNVSYTPRHRGK